MSKIIKIKCTYGYVFPSKHSPQVHFTSSYFTKSSKYLKMGIEMKKKNLMQRVGEIQQLDTSTHCYS